MTVHNLAEYVAFHQQKLREQNQQAAQASPSASASQPRKKGVNPIHSKSSFQTSVVDGSAEKLVLLDCFATWCGPCKAIAPTIAAFSEKYDGVGFYKIDVDELPEVAQELGIRAMPTFIFFKNGEKLQEIVGADPRKIEQFLEENK